MLREDNLNILILGGYGQTGKLLAKHLLAQTNHNIIIAGRNLNKGCELETQLNNPRVSTRQADASDLNNLKLALHNVDFMLVAAPTTHHAGTVIRAALEAHIDYLDVQFSSRKLSALYAAQDEIKQAGLCFITEAGFHPGLPSAMIRYAASKLDTIESAVTAGYLNIGDIPYTEAADELMEGFIDYQSQVYKNGTWTKRNSWDMRKFNFGSEFGIHTCYSMYFEELGKLPEMLPSLKDTGFYIAGWNWFADLIVTPIILIGLKLAPKRGIRPLGKLMWWAMMQSKPPYVVALKVEAKGKLNGRQRQVNAQIEHEDGYELTAIPVVAFLKQYDQVRCAGVHMMGHLAEPNQLFRDMQSMGAHITLNTVE